MSDPQRVEQARIAIEQILSILQVSRVISVDDTNLDEPSVEDVIVAACSLDEASLHDAIPELGDSIPGDQDILKEQIRRLWNELDKPVRSGRAKAVLAALRRRDDEQTDDLGDASILSELIPKDKFLLLSPEQWNAQHDQLLEEEHKWRTLFLFDQDLSNDGGDAGGIKIISSLLARDGTENLICGLLTHTVKPEEQLRSWEELSKAYSIPRDRFLVIPKQHLSRDPVLIAQSLKLVALSPEFVELKEKVKKIITDAASVANDSVESINIYDLDYIVFQVPDKEGMWEPDMLFRLYALYHRLESRRLAHEKGELEAIACRLRLVSHIPTQTDIRLSSAAWDIQRKEMYESAEYLNKNHLPIELGDIFKKTDGGSAKRYILLAQPCDLMVRRTGKREPEIIYVSLAEIAASSGSSPYEEEMEYLGDNSSERMYVNVKRVHQVPLDMLDLCVFNDDGIATMWFDRDAPNTIRPAWKARYQELAKSARRLYKKLDSLSPVAGEPQDVTRFKLEHKAMLTSEILSNGLCRGKLVEQNGHHGIAYNCQRIGRLSRAQAFGLLMAYTSCLSRPAYDATFG